MMFYKKKKIIWIGYEILFLGGIIAVFLFMKIIPFLMSIGYSFTSWNGVTSEIAFTEWIISKRCSRIRNSGIP